MSNFKVKFLSTENMIQGHEFHCSRPRSWLGTQNFLIMGNQQSVLEEIINQTNFSEEEVTRLYKRFVKLDKDGSGSIDTSEFMAIPQVSSNPLAHRLLDVFDSDGSGDVDFKEFLIGLSAFSQNGKQEDKLRCIISISYLIKVAFKLYDIDRDGYISNGELFLVLVGIYF